MSKVDKEMVSGVCGGKWRLGCCFAARRLGLEGHEREGSFKNQQRKAWSFFLAPLLVAIL